MTNAHLHTADKAYLARLYALTLVLRPNSEAVSD
jgi:hypothetical protein